MLQNSLIKSARLPAVKSFDLVQRSNFRAAADIRVNVARRIDEQIMSDAKRALEDCGYPQLRQVRAYCDHGRITLQGRVTTYYLKQVAQEAVRSIAHVRDVDNDLHVVCPG